MMCSNTCRLNRKLAVIFHGRKSDSSMVDLLDLLAFFTNYSIERLVLTARTSSSVIYLQDPVTWEIGQEILLTPIVFSIVPQPIKV